MRGDGGGNRGGREESLPGLVTWNPLKHTPVISGVQYGATRLNLLKKEKEEKKTKRTNTMPTRNIQRCAAPDARVGEYPPTLRCGCSTAFHANCSPHRSTYNGQLPPQSFSGSC